MENLEQYQKEFKKMVEKIIMDGPFDEDGEGEYFLTLSMNSKKEILGTEINEEGEFEDNLTEEEVMLRISEYIQNERSTFLETSKKLSLEEEQKAKEIRQRALDILEIISLQLEAGLQIPYLETRKPEIANCDRKIQGYLGYNEKSNLFQVKNLDGQIKPFSMEDAMPLVFNYIFQRTNAKNAIKFRMLEDLEDIPKAYYVDLPTYDKKLPGQEKDWTR